MNDVSWICIPVPEPHLEISLLEIEVIQPRPSKCSLENISEADRLTTRVAGDEILQTDCQDDQMEDAVTEDSHKTDNKYGREAYGKMIDSDDERSWSSSEEEQYTSGYERHFMPTASEILEISWCFYTDSLLFLIFCFIFFLDPKNVTMYKEKFAEHSGGSFWPEESVRVNDVFMLCNSW